jgi:O-antigen/teichoic acid export membrane protein
MAGVSLTIARLYGPRGTGVISLAMNLSDVALQIFAIGLGAGITYLLSRGEWPLHRVGPELRNASIGLGLLGAVVSFAFYLLTRHTVFKGVTPTLAILALGTLPFALFWGFSAAAALGRDRYEAYAALEVGYSLVFLVAGVGLVLAFGLVGALIAFAVANLVTAAAGLRWLRREAARGPAPFSLGEPDAGPPLGEQTDQLRRAARFGVKTWSANLLQLLNYRLDLFILSSVALRSAVGVYSIAVAVTAIGWVLPNAFQTVLFPRVASLDAAAGSGGSAADASDAGEASDAAAARAVRHTVLFTVPNVLAVAVLILVVPLLYGSRFQQSVSLAFILLPGVAALGLAKVISAVFTGRGFPKYALHTTVLTVPITVALYVVLIPSAHATGAAIASTMSYIITLLLSIYYFKRATGIALRSALIPSRSDVVDYVEAIRAARSHVRR